MNSNISVLLMTSKSAGGFNFAPPIGLYRLKNYLEKHGIMCDILDFDIDSEDSYLQKVSSGHYDIVGMSVSHINMESDLEVILKFHFASKKSDKETIFIAGGQEATLNYKQWLSSGLIDVIFLGFAEEALNDFCLNLSSTTNKDNVIYIAKKIKVKGVAFIDKDGCLVYNPSPPLTTEGFRQLSFNNIIGPDIPYKNYWRKVKSKKIDGFNHTDFIIETVRLYTTSHCPRRCGFCSSQAFLPASQKVPIPIIMLSAEDIYELVLHHIDKYGARGFLFSDDDFLVGNRYGMDRIYKFCNLIINAKNTGRISENVKFFCQSRVADYIENKRVRMDLLEIMKNAGFDNTGLGIESFSDRLLKSPSINKVGVTVEDYRMVIDALLEKKIIPIIFIIVGIPESTVEELVETMCIAVDYICKGADVSVTARLRVNPGAPLCSMKRYNVSVRTWNNPFNGNSLTIEDYYIPNDRTISSIIGKIHEVAEIEINNIKIQRNWTGEIMPKSLIGIATFIATAKLIDRYDVADDFIRIMNKMLDSMS